MAWLEPASAWRPALDCSQAPKFSFAVTIIFSVAAATLLETYLEIDAEVSLHHFLGPTPIRIAKNQIVLDWLVEGCRKIKVHA
jgi:hypothetical protein